MSNFCTTLLLATEGSEQQSWWCASTKKDKHSTLHFLSIVNVPKLHTV
jgi:hypothetical protein